MKLLKDILYKVNVESVFGSTNIAVGHIVFDTRKVQYGSLFVAIKGFQVDGHDYIEKAIESGAKIIVCEVLPESLEDDIVYVQTLDSKKALAIIASNFYDNPSSKLDVIGVTGTNGKTTVTSLLYQLFKKAGFKVGLISTVIIKIDGVDYETKHTTPDPLLLQYYLNEMTKEGVGYCFMEVSSHGIHQKRIEGISFRGGVFTNLTHDHLDYHKTFKEYRDVKKSFFDGLRPNAFALTNIDDKNGMFMLQNCNAVKKTFALKNFADYQGRVLENEFSGLLLKINDKEVWSRMIGDFNAYNLLTVFAVAELLGLEEIEILEGISDLNSVNGRFQYLKGPKDIVAIVDYAHTPDALKNVLQTINNIRTRNEKLITVIGCGGDRDAQKRPIMGGISASLSDQVIFTSDNPRNEDPNKIIEDIENGVEPSDYKKTTIVPDRKQAIKLACKMAAKGDIILIAGKGHETYQEINGERFDFDDFAIVSEMLNKIQNN